MLRRYIGEGRMEAGVIKVLLGYFMSILDRYDDAVRNGTGDEYNLLPGHKAWGAAGRVRIYEELARQGILSKILRSPSTPDTTSAWPSGGIAVCNPI